MWMVHQINEGVKQFEPHKESLIAIIKKIKELQLPLGEHFAQSLLEDGLEGVEYYNKKDYENSLKAFEKDHLHDRMENLVKKLNNLLDEVSMSDASKKVEEFTLSIDEAQALMNLAKGRDQSKKS